MKKKKILLSLLIVAISASSSFAMLPVTDAGAYAMIAKQMLAQKLDSFKQIQQMIQQIQDARTHFQETLKYQNMINGEWKQTIQSVKAEYVRASLTIRDFQRLGWDSNDLGTKINAAYRTLDAADNALKDIQQGRKTADGVKDALESVYGAVPATAQAGVVVNADYKRMASSVALSGDLAKAMDQLQKENEADNQLIAQGGLAPGDIQRVQARQVNRSSQISILQLKATDNQNQLLTQMLGHQAQSQVNQNNTRLSEQERRRDIASMVRLAPNVTRGGTKVE